MATIETSDDAYGYTEDDMLDSEVLFGTCDVEQKIYTNCLRSAKTERSRGWRKYWYAEENVVKEECKKENFELEICEMTVQWRAKVAQQSCHHLFLKYEVFIYQ